MNEKCDAARLLWSGVMVAATVMAAVLLRGFASGVHHGDPEYYLLLGSILCGGVAAFVLAGLLSKRA